MKSLQTLSRTLSVCVLAGVIGASANAADNTQFVPLFNGENLAGWRGGETFDHRKLLAMTNEQRAAQIEKWNKNFAPHWSVDKDELVNDGQGT